MNTLMYRISTKNLPKITYMCIRNLRGERRHVRKRLVSSSEESKTLVGFPTEQQSTEGRNETAKLIQNPVEHQRIPHDEQDSTVATLLSKEELAAYSKTLKPLIRELKSSQPKENTEKIVEVVTENNQHDILARCVTPLSKVQYTAQLDMKHKMASDALTEYRKRLAEIAKSAGRTDLKTHLLPCPLQYITSSPEMEKYRNKDEFIVYRGVDGNPKTVGFLTGHPKLETTVCVPPTGLLTLKDSHKAVCSHFEHFIRSSKHPSCLHFRDSSGVWRSIVVRSTRTGELLAAVTIHPYTLQQEEITEIEDQLRDYFFSGPGQEVGLTSLYLQVCPHSRCSRDTAPYKLLEGAPYITESCLGASFRIKPDTFFQANTSAAENLYAVVQEVAELSPLTTVVDIGCGSGSISLLLAKHVRGTLGLEVVEAAVQDANDNAAANNVNNASFIPGPPEKVLPMLCQELAGCTDVVAIVNPGRGGLHPRVIQTIRSTHGLNKLLYLSNRPLGYALSNFVSLAHNKPGSKLERLPPMVPSFAFSVDTLPHTPHFEMGILFVKQELTRRNKSFVFE